MANRSDDGILARMSVPRCGNAVFTSPNLGKRVIDVGAIIQVMFHRRL